jgi:hypothetical protein
MFKKPNTTGRPVLTLEWKPIDLLLEASSLLVIIVSTVLLLADYSALPDEIPTHFNAQGIADDYGSKSSLFFLLALCIATYLLITWITKLPQNFNYPVKITEYNATYQYRLSMRLLRWIKLAVVFNFAWMLYSATQAALNGEDHLSPSFVVFFLASVFIPLVIYFYLAQTKKAV